MNPIPVTFKGQLVSDDVFDQLVEDVLAEMDSDEEEQVEEEQVESPPAKTSTEDEKPSAKKKSSDDEEPADDGETLALDDEDDLEDEDTAESNFEITSDDAPKPAEAKAAAKPDKSEVEKSPTGDSAASKAKAAEGDSAIDEKSSGRATLPLCTAGEFVHPGYDVTHTLSVISARRVVSLGDLSEKEGRLSEGETLVATVERELKVELRAIAAKRGAHAVVGVTLQYTAPGNGMLIAVAAGTPVRLSKRSEAK